MDKEVSEYIKKQISPQKEILLRLRKLILKTLPDCQEEMRWGVPVFAGGKFYTGVVSDRVHFGFSINGLDQSEIKFLEGSGKTMRHIKIHSLEDIDEKILTKLIKAVDKKSVCKSC